LAYIYCVRSELSSSWEKVALFRLGRYVGLRGPGLFHIVPVLETLSPYVDQRVRVASVSAESTLTRDTVPVNVDAIVFWLVWNAEKAILEVENFMEAIHLSAQTALRESIGRHELAQMITEREVMGRGQAETEISDKFVQAAAAYAENPVALHLRAMNMLYEAIKEKGSMVIVPSSAVETMGLGGTLATASLGGAKP
jgi:regulator of protease activity HflC (stomatin/prohibitin superfamily)